MAHTTQIDLSAISFTLKKSITSSDFNIYKWEAPCGCRFSAESSAHHGYIGLARPCFDSEALFDLEGTPETEEDLCLVVQQWLASWDETAIAEMEDGKKTVEEAKDMFASMLMSVYPQYVEICGKVGKKPMSEEDWREMRLTNGCDCCAYDYLPDNLW